MDTLFAENKMVDGGVAVRRDRNGSLYRLMCAKFGKNVWFWVVEITLRSRETEGKKEMATHGGTLEPAGTGRGSSPLLRSALLYPPLREILK